MKTVPTFTATIYVGFHNRNTGLVHTIDEARAVIQKYVDSVGLCVTVTPTEFIYTNGSEPGISVGLINYPRFPSMPDEIKSKALALARQLCDAMEQYRVSIMFTDETIMINGIEK